MKQIVKLVKGVQFPSSAKNALMQNVFQFLADAMNVEMRKQMEFTVDSI